MPIVNKTNNRILPSNARAADVASDALKRIIPIQNRRYDAAFRVNGYSGILYNRLGSGIKCSCGRHQSEIGTRLGLDGKADSGLINQLLSGGSEFGVRPYGAVPARQPSYFEVQTGVPVEDQPVVLPSLYETDDPARTIATSTIHGSHLDRYSVDGSDPGATVVIADGEGNAGPIRANPAELDDFVSDADLALHAHSDIACPVCFGTGFVSGFSVFNGWRLTLVPYSESAVLPAGAELDLEVVPSIVRTDHMRWTRVVLPSHVVQVDAVRLWNSDQPVVARLKVDGQVLTSPEDIRAFCDGGPHDLEVESEDGSEIQFSHLELQFGQSTETANFELPKLTKNSNMSLLDTTDPIQVIFSPLISLIRPRDLIVESTTGRHFLVTDCVPWNDRRATVLGWEATLRVSQPHELFTMLPQRSPNRSPNQRPNVRDNVTGPRRT